jgi:hypothetical protein
MKLITGSLAISTGLCMTVFLIAAIFVSSFYYKAVSDDIYNEKAFCKIVNTVISNETCQHQCNCRSCGLIRCCNSCDYKCYYTYWNVSVNILSNFNSTDINGSWPFIAKIRSSSESLNDVTNNLNKYPIGSIHVCYYDSNNYNKVSWDKSSDSAITLLLLIIFWLICGACFILMTISATLFTIYHYNLYRSGTDID